ncbi:MAG: hypothetical protein E5W57_28740 [Mesorhizobium sp.]|nr:MAG: hypothetical protein E5W57_28740 [Mesorhizobium sp.]
MTAIIVLLGVWISAAHHEWANKTSPIQSVDALDVTIKSAYSGKGGHTSYLIVLDDGSVRFVGDDRPHPIGARERIERITLKNGSISYRFLE